MSIQIIKDARGFTLVEMMIVLIITGALFAGMIAFYIQWDKASRFIRTQDNLEIIADALAAYAVRNYRIPCPADPRLATVNGEPHGYEINSGADGGAIGGCAGATAHGIVPFKTLGLSSEHIKDGWNNYITYKVSTALVNDPEVDIATVHGRCRTTDWIEGSNLRTELGNQWFENGRSLAPLKARFCCRLATFAGAGADAISINTIGGGAGGIYNADSAGWYNFADTITDHYDNHAVDGDGVDVVTTDTGAQPFYSNIIYGGGITMGAETVFAHTDFPVYVLISHGENGAGAFLNTGGQTPLSASPAEQTNASTATPIIVQDILRDVSLDATYFDDVVYWQTQSQMLARLNRDSCAVP